MYNYTELSLDACIHTYTDIEVDRRRSSVSTSRERIIYVRGHTYLLSYGGNTNTSRLYTLFCRFLEIYRRKYIQPAKQW